jgi:RND family efflux transporter MFP subunit
LPSRAGDRPESSEAKEKKVADPTDKLDELRIDRSDRETPRPKSWLWIAAFALAALGAVAVWLSAGRSAGPEVSVATVREVTTTSGVSVLDASGYVTARRKATVSSKITGKVVEVLVEEGLEVRKGQVLARLDDSLQSKGLALAEAQLSSARSAVEEIAVRLEEARIHLRRVKELVEQDVSSEATLDTARAQVDSFVARLAVGHQEAEVADKMVIFRRQELEDTIIRAPFDGVAVSKDAQPGEMVSPISAGGGFTRTGISTIVDMTSLEIEVDVNESYINRVRSDQRVEAVLDAYPDWRIPGKVITTVPTADRQKATVRVRIGFDELDPRILPDMGIKVTFLGGEEASTDLARARLVIPRDAMRREDGRDVVFILRDDQLERRAVRLGAISGNEVEVVSGLAAGERVIIEGPDELADGDRVVVK